MKNQENNPLHRIAHIRALANTSKTRQNLVDHSIGNRSKRCIIPYAFKVQKIPSIPRFNATTKASTQGSGTQTHEPLSVTKEDISYESSSISGYTSKASFSMEDFTNMQYNLGKNP